jgi:hypothetical protein
VNLRARKPKTQFILFQIHNKKSQKRKQDNLINRTPYPSFLPKSLLRGPRNYLNSSILSDQKQSKKLINEIKDSKDDLEHSGGSDEESSDNQKMSNLENDDRSYLGQFDAKAADLSYVERNSVKYFPQGTINERGEKPNFQKGL